MKAALIYTHTRARDALCPCYRKDKIAFRGEGEPADWFLDCLNTLFWYSFLTPRQKRLLSVFYQLWNDNGYERDILETIAKSERVPMEVVGRAYHHALEDLSRMLRWLPPPPPPCCRGDVAPPSPR